MVGFVLMPWHNRIDAALGLLLAQPPMPGAINCVRDVMRIAAGDPGSAAGAATFRAGAHAPSLRLGSFLRESRSCDSLIRTQAPGA